MLLAVYRWKHWKASKEVCSSQNFLLYVQWTACCPFKDFFDFTNPKGYMFHCFVAVNVLWHASGLCLWGASGSRWLSGVHWQSKAETVPCFGLPVCAWLQLPQCWPPEPPALCHTREETKWEGGYHYILRHSPSRQQLAQGRVIVPRNCQVTCICYTDHLLQQSNCTQTLKSFPVYLMTLSHLHMLYGVKCRYKYLQTCHDSFQIISCSQFTIVFHIIFHCIMLWLI